VALILYAVSIMKRKDTIAMFDPNLQRGERMRTFEEDRQRMEKQGIYKAPNFMLRGTISFAIVVLFIILIAVFLFHLF
jgi:hypothetical protein